MKSLWEPKHRYERYIPTNDEWYPNFENNTVLVFTFVNKFKSGKYYFKAGATGADDFSLEVEELNIDFERAHSLFTMWVKTFDSLSMVCKSGLIAMGMNRG